jgi:3-phenylpropionate/trans-cinnamate dioxygenase ferredoxin component
MSELSFDSLIEGKPVSIDLNGKAVCVARVGDEVFAVADTCTHSDASLSEGEVSGFKLSVGCMAQSLICAVGQR